MERRQVARHQRAPVGAARASDTPRRSSASHPVLGLQSRLGNRASGSFLQTKLRVGQPDDTYEREADTVADRVMRMPAGGSGRPVQRLTIGAIQLKCAECEREDARRSEAGQEDVQREPIQAGGDSPLEQREEEDEDQGPSSSPLLQRQPVPEETATSPGPEPEERVDENAPVAQSKAMAPGAPHATARAEPAIDAARGRGQTLSDGSRSYFEPRFGADFSAVRIHTDAGAAAVSRQLRARAFTVGNDVFFGAGQYRPDSESGRRLMAHELTHVIQQGGGSSAGPAESAPGRTSLLQRDEDESSAPDVAVPEPSVAGDADDEEGAGEIPTPPAAGSGGGDAEPEADAEWDGTLEPWEEEFEIPSFGIGGEDCFQLVPQGVCTPDKGSEAGSLPESVLSRLVGIAMSGPAGGIVGPILSKLGQGALFLWKKLPLPTRAWAINKAIDLALSGAEFLPAAALKGDIFARWIHAGILGYLRRLRRAPDAEKVQAFEKYLTIIVGADESFSLGFAKGVLCGFFVDGLVGIVQMVIDLICLVTRIPQFIDAFRKFWGAFPAELAAAATAVSEFASALSAALSNAVAEVWELMRDPGKIVGLVETVAEAGAEGAEKIGERIAQELLALAKGSTRGLGFRVGQAAGVILFEVLLAVVTAGGGAAVTATKVGARVAVKIVATIGRNIMGVIHFLKPFLGMFRRAVGGVKKYLTTGFRFAAGKLEKALDAIKRFFASILKRCRPGSTKCKRRKKKLSRREKALLQIKKLKVQIRLLLANPLFRRGRFARPGGSIRTRFPRIANVPKSERAFINAAGDKFGDHHTGAKTSGLKSGTWIPDHIPVTELVLEARRSRTLKQMMERQRLPTTLARQRLYPHSQSTALVQGGLTTAVKLKVAKLRRLKRKVR